MSSLRLLIFATRLLLGLMLFLLSIRAKDLTNLKEAYGDKFALGAAIPNPNLTEAELKILLANFTNITPEGCMKPQPTEPQEGVYTFEQADALADFAQRNGLKINGHCLVWDQSCPNWFFMKGNQPADRDVVLKRMVDHITTEATHLKGKGFQLGRGERSPGRRPGLPETDPLAEKHWRRLCGSSFQGRRESRSPRGTLLQRLFD